MIEKSNDISVTPTITALLKPTADYLGDELKDIVKSQVEKAKVNKRSENLKVHLERVKLKDSYSKYESRLAYEQLDLFDDWVDSVSKVDPEDELISQIWQNLLIDKRSSFNAEVLLEVLKNINSGDAIALIKVFEKVTLNKEDLYRLKELKKKGLVQLNDFKIGLINLFAFILCFIFALFSLYLFFDPPSIVDSIPDYLQKVMVFLPLTLIFSTGFIVSHVLKNRETVPFRVWQLTWLGERLVKLSES